MQFLIISDGLTRGLHFRRKIRIHTAQLREGERGNFDVVAFLFLRIVRKQSVFGKGIFIRINASPDTPLDDALFLQADSQIAKCGHVRKAPACGFR